MSLRSSLLKAIAVIALAISPALAAPPDGKIEINYHRCDGKYEKWGVHLWKSPNMPLPDIEWPNPMMPTAPTTSASTGMWTWRSSTRVPKPR